MCGKDLTNEDWATWAQRAVANMPKCDVAAMNHVKTIIDKIAYEAEHGPKGVFSVELACSSK